MALSEQIRILLVEDNPGDADLISEYLIDSMVNDYEICHVETLKMAIKEIDGSRFDIILLDLSLPDSYGLSGPASVKEMVTGIPIIILTGNEDMSLPIKTISEGIDDYLVKNDLNSSILGRAIVYSIERKRSQIELMKTRELLHETARFESVGKVAAGVGHDLNNILSGIIMFNELISDSSDLVAIKKYASIQKNSIDIGLNFVSNLLAFSKSHRNEYKLFYPGKTIDSIIGILQKRIEKNSIILHKNIGLNISMVGDEGKFSQVCMNLIVNSCDAMADGGQLNLSLGENSDKIIFKCQDTGHGIPEVQQKEIFDLLYTTKETGSGIGLYITNKIVKDAGGEILLLSNQEQGTKFEVQLPKTWDTTI